MESMERLHRQYPDDDEVGTFYAVSLLSGARALKDETFRLEVKAGAIALDAFERNPKHPGAAHYTIHSFDDPIHAPLALEAADAYAAIAPAVSHAIHMPTHIFIQHGMWEKVAEQNMRAHRVASDLWEPKDSMGDMAHSLDWGQYGYLQRGDYEKARKAIARFEEMVAMEDQSRAKSSLALAKARYIIETGEWKVQDMSEEASEEELLANGMSAVETGDLATAEKMAERLSENVAANEKKSEGGHEGHGGTPPQAFDDSASTRVMHLEMKALVALAKGEKDEAVATLREAVEAEEAMRPPNGAADPVKPSHELLGEVLLEVGKPADAAKAFDKSLLRMPNRALSLLGSARAHAQAGHRDVASERYRKLAEIWKDHEELAGFQEARQYLASTDDR
jgi:tetratricopeptide (TPR) repeat protein